MAAMLLSLEEDFTPKERNAGDYFKHGEMDGKRGTRQNEMVDRGPDVVARGNYVPVIAGPCQLFPKDAVTLADTFFFFFCGAKRCQCFYLCDMIL